MIAALFVERGGAYYGIPDVDPSYLGEIVLLLGVAIFVGKKLLPKSIGGATFSESTAGSRRPRR